MARTRFFKTPLVLSLDAGGQRELSLVIGYDFTPGFAGSRDEPAYGAQAEVHSVRMFWPAGGGEIEVPSFILSMVETDPELLASLVDDAAEQDASDAWDAAERKAEAARDDALMEGR